MHEMEVSASLPDEIASGQGIGLAQAARLLPVDASGRATHPATLTRWIKNGTTSASGRTVHLEALRVGRRLLTSAGAIRRFLARLAQQDDTPAIPAPPTGRAAERLREAETRRLRELGL
jgi:hypothetical protein